MKRGLVFTKYGTLAATTRQRIEQAEPYLRDAGIAIDLCPLFDNVYLTQLFTTGKRSKLAMAAAYWRRFCMLLSCRRYDFIWVQYELFPYLPAMFERLIGLSGLPVIYDCDDAIFHQYDQHKNPLLRRVLGKKIQPLLRRCTLAFCGNEYLRDYVMPHCPRAEIIPTVVNMKIYVPTTKPPTMMPVLGWIGSPSTWAYCQPLTGMLASLVEAQQLTVLVVGAGHAANAQLPFTFRDWTEAGEVADVQQMDIGIMPIPDEPWARGKCGYKLIQYMACGIPVIASPVGVNREIVQHGVNGFLATTEQQWRDAIAQLLADAALRQRMGQAGRARVEGHYAIQQTGPRMAQLIQELLANQL